VVGNERRPEKTAGVRSGNSGLGLRAEVPGFEQALIYSGHGLKRPSAPKGAWIALFFLDFLVRFASRQNEH
jgi:hypothetical protein